MHITTELSFVRSFNTFTGTCIYKSYELFKVAYTCGQFSSKTLNGYPIIFVQIIDHQVAKMHKLNILSVKLYFNSVKNDTSIFVFFSRYMV